jgi:hypothetical protein
MNYGWEINRKFETALQTGFFENKIVLDLVYYRNVSTQQLLGRTLPSTTGFESVQYNLPVSAVNSGFEISIRTTPTISSDVKWIVSSNLTFPSSRLLRYDGLASSSDRWRYAVGEPINVLLRYQYEGINDNTGEFLYRDTNLDHSLNASDLKSSKAYGPRWYGGIDNVVTYKAFQLSLLVQYVKQTRESIIGTFMAPGSLDSNQPRQVMRRWQNAGDDTEYHRFTQSANGKSEYLFGRDYGDNAFDDASYFRIKNVELAFSLPTKWTQKLSLHTASISIRAQNLLTITNYFGLDPENASIQALPPLRTISFGVHLTL